MKNLIRSEHLPLESVEVNDIAEQIQIIDQLSRSRPPPYQYLSTFYLFDWVTS